MPVLVEAQALLLTALEAAQEREPTEQVPMVVLENPITL
jgi:hypothetical protein